MLGRFVRDAAAVRCSHLSGLCVRCGYPRTLIKSAVLLPILEMTLLGSGLSFLDLGVQSPQTWLGSMVGYGRVYLTCAPRIRPDLAVTILQTTLSVSLIGEWLRDRLGPTLR